MMIVIGILILFNGHAGLQASIVADIPQTTEGLEGPWPVPINGKWGYINSKGKLVLPAAYDDARLFREGLAAVQKGIAWNFIAEDGRSISREPYRRARSFMEGYAAVENANGWGFIDTQGVTVIPNQYRGAGDFSERRAPVLTDKGWGFIDPTGKFVIKPEFEEVGRFREGLARVRKKHRSWFYIDPNGRKVITGPYQVAADFSEGLACTEAGGGVSFIDVKGERKFQLGENYNAGCLEDRSLMIDGLALVLRVDYLLSTTMFVDKNGRILINPKHGATYRHGFSDGLAVFSAVTSRKDIRYGYINTKGHIAIVAIYESAEPFNKGLAFVTLDGRPAYIRTDGSKVWQGERR
jgi:hypothetical protein